MEFLAVAASVAVVSGSMLAAIAGRRLPFLAGVLVVLVLLPLCGRAFPVSTGWAFAAGAHLAATIAGATLLSAGLRLSARLPTERGLFDLLPPRAWAFLILATAVIGVAAWPLLIESLDPVRIDEGRAAGWTDPRRWALGAGMAALVGGLRLLSAVDVPRLAVGASFGTAGAWLVGIAAGSTLVDLSLLAVSVTLPAAAFVAMWRPATRPAGR